MMRLERALVPPTSGQVRLLNERSLRFEVIGTREALRLPNARRRYGAQLNFWFVLLQVTIHLTGFFPAVELEG
jgi:hypothetical protein